MRRRGFLQTGLVATAWLAASGHTPYRQWQVYRQKHLLIGTSKADAPTYPLGQKIAEVLATHLPESSARVTRGPDPWRLASLLTTGQLEMPAVGGRHRGAARRPPAVRWLGPHESQCAVRVRRLPPGVPAGLLGPARLSGGADPCGECGRHRRRDGCRCDRRPGGAPRRRARLCAGRADAGADHAGGRRADAARSRALTLANAAR